MQKRRLGNTELWLSVLGLGTVKFGRNVGVKYPKNFSLPTDKEIDSLLHLAYDKGINFLDTAPSYGESEVRLGKILGSNRAKWILSTKVGETFSQGESKFDFSKQAVLHSVETSLKNLKTDYLDLLLVHSNGEDEKIILEYDIFKTCEALKQTGKIRCYGMSSKTVRGGLLTIEQADVAMVTYRADYADEKEVIDYAVQQQKGILLKKALASGHVQGSVDSYFEFALSHPGVTSVVIGTINPEHLCENVDACERVMAHRIRQS